MQDSETITENKHDTSKYLFDYDKSYNLLKNTKYFNIDYYKENNPNIADGEDVIDYFLNSKFNEPYPTSKYFNPEWYLKVHNDIREAQINPLLHFLAYGQKEGRLYRYVKENIDKIDVKNKILVKECYDTLYDSIEFDLEYYLNNNNIGNLNTEPVLHYILEGANKGFNPSNTFDTNEYLKNHENIIINPLYSYILSKNAETIENPLDTNEIPSDFDYKYDFYTVDNMLTALSKKVSIIIPITNTAKELKKCIHSILLNTHLDYELCLIKYNDNNQKTNKLLESIGQLPQIKIIETDKGYAESINNIIEETGNDILLLEDTCIVTPNWLSKIIISTYKENRILSSTPLSLNDILPEASCGNINSLNDYGYKINKISSTYKCPVIVGSCFYIKHAAIDEIGLFDESFNKLQDVVLDFSSRINYAGFSNIIDSTVCLYNNKTSKKNMENLEPNKLLEDKHPEICEKYKEYLEIFLRLMEIISGRIKNKIPKRILYITTEDKSALDVVFDPLIKEYSICSLILADREISLKAHKDYNQNVTIKSWNIKNIRDKEFFIRLYYNILTNLKIDLIYSKNLNNLKSDKKLDIYLNFIKRLELPHICLPIYEDNKKIFPFIEDNFNNNKPLDEILEDISGNIDFKNKKTVVYTATTKANARLMTPNVIEDDFDYVCFTDNPDLKSDFWQMRHMEEIPLDLKRKEKRYKLLPQKYLEEYDYCIWVDSDIKIIGSLKEFINKYSVNHKLLGIEHEKNNCFYKEFDDLKNSYTESKDILGNQIHKYKDEHYPRNNGLLDTSVLFINNNDKDVANLMKTWYGEVINYSYLDQLSFNYSCWKNNFQYDESPICLSNNVYFKRLSESLESVELTYSKKQVKNILKAMDKVATIIIPIYNAYDETKACIESVLKYTDVKYQLLLINDCSPDKRIGTLLEKYEDYDNITVVNNVTNQGFVKNINLGCQLTDTDVVWLNSDTVVTCKWLEKLKTTAYSDSKIATATPLSNNAGAFSVPELNIRNPIDPQLGLQNTAKIVEKVSGNQTIEVPTGNGFCMYVKREAIDEVGLLDLAFEQGYGEENDFCMRLLNAGWRNVIDTSTYIYHDESASFKEEKEKLINKHRKYLRKKHESYQNRVRSFLNSLKYQEARDNISNHLNSSNKKHFSRKCILYVTYDVSDGNSPIYDDLIEYVHSDMDVYVVSAKLGYVHLFKFSKSKVNNGSDGKSNNLHLINSWHVRKDYKIGRIQDEEFRKVYYNIIKSLHVDIIHIHHLMGHSFDIPYIAKALGIPLVLSLHDFYYICTSHNLINDNKEYCGGYCTPLPLDSNKNKQCNVIPDLNAPIMKNYVSTWRMNVNDMFDCCSSFITTSQITYDIYTKFYPKLKGEDFRIIKQGCDLKTPDKVKVTSVNEAKPFRIVVSGNMDVSDGVLFIKELKKYDANNSIELHFLGNANPKYKLEEVGILEGKCEGGKFHEKIQELNPHAFGIFSIWPDTDYKKLYESWSCGVPVICFDTAALANCIKSNGGGFLVSRDPKKAYNEMLKVFINYDKYFTVSREISKISFKSTKQMVEEYMKVYNKFLKIEK